MEGAGLYAKRERSASGVLKADGTRPRAQKVGSGDATRAATGSRH
jgi:hypothetical protein